MSEVLEGEVVGEHTTDIAERHSAPLTVTPQVQAGELVKRLDVIRDAMNTAMKKDVDYGVIPGTNKPALLKPGAEKLSVLFQLDVQITNEKAWDGDHLTVNSRATVFHAPTGSRLGFGEGMCSTREAKYAWRVAKRICPQCGAAAIIKGKQEYGGGWLCFKKQDGCGAKFSDGDDQIEKQTTGKVPNPDLPDLWNTVLKMSEKRARVGAVLAVTGASALFTQDVEPDDVSSSAREPQAATDQSVSHEAAPASSEEARREPASPALISDSQRKRLRAIQHRVNCPDDVLKAMVLTIAEVSSSKEIPVAKYDELCGAVEAYVAPPELCGECGEPDGQHRIGCSQDIPF